MNQEEIVEAAHTDGQFELEGETFVLTQYVGSPLGPNFSLIKPAESVGRYLELVDSFVDPPRIVELGVAHGGSTAFLALAAKPQKLVAFELDDERIPVLDQMLERQDLTERVSIYYGVDQADTETLLEITARELGDAAVDLVIDDASHLLEPTLATFNAMFPLLREGGTYVIEDWCCDHRFAQLLESGSKDESSIFHGWAVKTMGGDFGGAPPGHRPLFSVAAEMMGAPPWRPGETVDPLSKIATHLLRCTAEVEGLIDSLTISGEWIVATRGPAKLDPGWRLEQAGMAGPLADIFQP